MRSPRRRRDAFRTARFEPIEPRLVLSVGPAGPLAADQIVQASFSANFSPPTNLDAHELTGLTEALEQYDFTGAGQTVVIIDSGVAYDHIALGGGLGAGYTVVGGWDFTEENDADPYDDGPYGSHGTHVAGIIASANPNNPGVAPGVDVVALRVFNDAGQTQLGWVEDALAWVHENRNSLANPITTVNLSIGLFTNTDSPPDDAVLEDELAQLAADGIFIAAAAGNGFTRFEEPGLSYPASSPYVTAVGSVDSSGELSYFTQRDTAMLTAPGRSVNSTVPDYVGNRNGIADDYAQYSGTSMASPYVAGAAVLVREAYQSIGQGDVSAQTIHDTLFTSADVVHDAATGADYRRLNIARAIETALSYAEPVVPVIVTKVVDGSPTMPDPVAVEQIFLNNQEVSPEASWYGFTATADGILTVEALFDHDAGDVDLQITDPDGQVLGGGYSSDDNERVDLTVAAGETVFVRLATEDGTTNGDVDLRVTNLVEVDGRSLLVRGTDGDDQFRFIAGTDYRLTINGVEYDFDGGRIDSVSYDAGAGTDTAQLHGTAGADSVVLRPTTAEVSATGLRIAVTDAENITFVGRGGHDVVSFHDSPGDDRFTASAGSAQMIGPGFSNQVSQVEIVHAYAKAGGADEASLYDTPGDDFFIGTSTYGRMVGDDYVLRAKFFEATHAYAGGGYDSARLIGSAANEMLIATPVYAKLIGSEQFNRVKFFDNVVVQGGGGFDRGYLYDSSGRDTLIARPSVTTLSGAGYSNSLRQFDLVIASASAGGLDSAVFHDSAGADAFFANSVEARMSGSGYMNSARGFDRVTARATGGYDQATLFDSVLDDHFAAEGDHAQLKSSALVTWVYDFDQVRAIRSSVGDDTAEIDAVDFVLEVLGPWDQE